MTVFVDAGGRSVGANAVSFTSVPRPDESETSSQRIILMTTCISDPIAVDTSFQRLVRKCVNGQATADEINEARQAAGLSPLEALLLAEAIDRQSQTFVGCPLVPLC